MLPLVVVEVSSGVVTSPEPDPVKQSSSSHGLPTGCFALEFFAVVTGERVGGTYTGVIRSSPENSSTL